MNTIVYKDFSKRELNLVSKGFSSSQKEFLRSTAAVSLLSGKLLQFSLINLFCSVLVRNFIVSSRYLV